MRFGELVPRLLEPGARGAVGGVRDRRRQHPVADRAAVVRRLEGRLQLGDFLLVLARELAEVGLAAEAKELRVLAAADRLAEPAQRRSLHEVGVALVDRAQLELGLQAGVVEVVLLFQLGEEAVGAGAIAVELLVREYPALTGPRIRPVREFTVRTERRSQLVDITEQVRRALGELDGASAVLVYVPHTTAGVTINEHADPAVARDFESALERIVADDWPWQHVEEGRRTRRRTSGLPSWAPTCLSRSAKDARARHVAGNLPLRVRRPARALRLRHDARVIEVEGLSKRFGKTQAVAAQLPGRAGHDHGLSGRTGPASRPRCAPCARARPSGRGQRDRSRRPVPRARPAPAPRRCRAGSERGPPGPVGSKPPAGAGHGCTATVLAGRGGARARRAEREREAARQGHSLGMRQRPGLATALLGDPEVLVLEPANGLDPAGIRWPRDFLRSLAAEGRTILVSSHVLAEVAQTVDRVVIIHRGKLVQQATIAEVIAGASGSTRVRTPDPARFRDLLVAQGASVAAADSGVPRGRPRAERVGELAAAHGIVLHELTVERATLEEVFLELTGGETTE